MAVDFRCEKCGKLLNVDAEPGSKVRCPHCNKKLRVPAALATLPRPQMPVEVGQFSGQTAGPPPPEGEEDEAMEGGPDPVMALMAALMPWVLSVFFHLGLALIMLFFVLVSYGVKKKEIEPSATASSLDDKAMSVSSSSENLTKRSTAAKARKSYSSHESNIPSDSGKIKKSVELGRGSAAGNPDAPFGGGRRGGGSVGSFYGTGSGGAKYVIFVIDRSGSMVTVFDYVRLQMQLSISGMNETQSFHIVLFADEKYLEGPSSRLVAATGENKVAVVEFLERDDIRPQGRTTALVALKRAFQVFDGAADKKGKLLLFLTDGEFAGIGGGSRYKGASGNEAVIKWLADNNTNKSVTINTYLYIHGTSAKAKQVMNQIAREHGRGGKAKLIGPDE